MAYSCRVEPPNSPRRGGLLPFLWLALAGMLAAITLLVSTTVEAESPDELADRLATAMRRERWETAVELAERIVAQQPEDAASVFNLACALARAGAIDRALDALQRAAELGFSFVTTLREDPDLDPLRSHPRFAAAVAAIEATHDREFASMKARADASHPLLFGPPAEERAEPAPLIVLLHGRGGRAEDLADLWLPSAAAIGAVVVAPEAFTPLGRGFQWLKADDAVYRVRQAIEYAASLFPVDRRRVVVAGFSQGAHVALVAASRHPELFAGVIAIAACDRDGVELQRLGTGPRPRLYLAAGSEDPVHSECRRMAKRYRQMDFQVETRTYPGYGHEFPQNYRSEFDRALRHVLASAADHSG